MFDYDAHKLNKVAKAESLVKLPEIRFARSTSHPFFLPMVVIHKHRRLTSTYVVYWHEALKHPSIAPLSKVQTIRVSKHACQSPFVSGRTSSSAVVPSSARQRQRRADSSKHVAVRPGNISQCQGRAHEPTIGSERPVTSRAWVCGPMQSLTLPCAGPCSIGEVTLSPAAVHLQ